MPPRYDTRALWTICSIAALGGLLFGYDWVVIGGAKPFYESYFRLTSQNAIGWANSCALLGCLAGSIASGLLSDRWGRKKVLILSAFLFAISSVLTGWVTAFTWFVVWRIAGGAAIGMASNVSPMYIAEVSPAELRGRLVSLNQLTIVVGILVAQIVNWMIAQPVPAGATAELIRQSWNGQYGWRWMFTAVAVPSVVFFAGACFIPESPRWLARAADPQPAATPWRTLLAPRLRKVLGIGVFLAVLQQWSGINVIFNYAEEISIGAYAMSLAPVTWVLISEIFPNRIRGLAVSVAVSALWVACFLLTFTFPLLNAALGPSGTFWVYGAICAIGFLFILFRVPETKGKTLEEIEKAW